MHTGRARAERRARIPQPLESQPSWAARVPPARKSIVLMRDEIRDIYRLHGDTFPEPPTMVFEHRDILALTGALSCMVMSPSSPPAHMHVRRSSALWRAIVLQTAIQSSTQNTAGAGRDTGKETSDARAADSDGAWVRARRHPGRRRGIAHPLITMPLAQPQYPSLRRTLQSTPARPPSNPSPLLPAPTSPPHHPVHLPTNALHHPPPHPAAVIHSVQPGPGSPRPIQHGTMRLRDDLDERCDVERDETRRGRGARRVRLTPAGPHRPGPRAASSRTGAPPRNVCGPPLYPPCGWRDIAHADVCACVSVGEEKYGCDGVFVERWPRHREPMRARHSVQPGTKCACLVSTTALLSLSCGGRACWTLSQIK
ncbi:hypothetical protein B0H10DRAFT_2445211 [Mycena sp. CBHHK59/15]|nr:hypothetical protein B0H10DRAFT_2445211 [Mycena sp. CBHHK59/15]